MKYRRQFFARVLTSFMIKMNVSFFFYALLSITFMGSCQEKRKDHTVAYLEREIPSIAQDLAYELLQANYLGKETKTLEKKLADLDPGELARELSTDTQRKTFWINVYNAYILVILKANPDLYQNRGSFFSDKRFTIAGEELSFDQVEHGIIRGGRAKYSFGYAQDVFRSRFERNFKVQKRDFRIHFALNCGAKSCPPVRLYKVESLGSQLEEASRHYLQQSSIWNAESQEVQATRLFSWFRGDFGGIKGVHEILKTYEIVPENASAKLEFLPYDWTLDLDNFQISEKQEARSEKEEPPT